MNRNPRVDSSELTDPYHQILRDPSSSPSQSDSGQTPPAAEESSSSGAEPASLAGPQLGEVTLSLEPLRDVSPFPGVSVASPGETGLHPAPLDLPERYVYQWMLGRGGMGEVHRVFDRYLNRPMALKVIQEHLAGSPEAESRFLAEAQATAQLQHPGIIPVHDIGRLPDRRYFFSMKEVQGRTLREVIREVHLASPEDHWGSSPTGWTFRRLIDTFHQVCEAVAYAHARGVVHRDLKPSNLMVGRFGEVLVMDWGLAKVRGSAEHLGVELALQPLQTVRTAEGIPETRVGRVAGTIAYMPPEQARGELDRLGPASDVYSLGAVLYEILSGEPLFHRLDEWGRLEQVRAGRWARPERGNWKVKETASGSVLRSASDGIAEPGWSRQAGGPPLPEELIDICARAMAPTPERRYAHAGELGEVVREWLEQARRRERGLEALLPVQELPARVKELRAEAINRRMEAQTLLARVPTWADVEQKRSGWMLEDEAARLEQEADLETIRYTQGVRGALTQDPFLPEAHEALAFFYQNRHQEAEAIRDGRAAAQWELLLREHDIRGRFATYLQGDGALSLVTDPPGAAVSLFRYEMVDRRLIPQFVRELGPTPLRSIRLEKGSYLLLLNAPGYQEVRYPVFIERGLHWDGVPPEGGEPHPIQLPRTGELGPDECYVPAGWFWAGGDEKAPQGSPELLRLWADGFILNRRPVTNQQYLTFLNDLVARGMGEEALTYAPRERSEGGKQEGALVWERGADGHFIGRGLGEETGWEPNRAVVFVDWFCARAYAVWWSLQTGEGWRLPAELEWEKAARGADGRCCPWGDEPEGSYGCMRGSYRGRPRPQDIDQFPVDESAYLVRGLAGNTQDWCLDVYRSLGPPHRDQRVVLEPADRDQESFRVLRGGSWFMTTHWLRSATRAGVEPNWRFPACGLRLARSYP